MTDAPSRASAPFTRTIALPGPAATDRLGAALGARLAAGDVVALVGDLGAGKSALARAAIRARLSDPGAEVPSPTFTLIQTYEAAELEIWHVDLYRLSDAADAEELGLIEAFRDAACLIEWPERLGVALPDRALRIELTPDGDGRLATLTAPDAWRHRLTEIVADVG
jgi:tRNA threonylcarbamoyl adenosine modification protein YjeE